MEGDLGPSLRGGRERGALGLGEVPLPGRPGLGAGGPSAGAAAPGSPPSGCRDGLRWSSVEFQQWQWGLPPRETAVVEGLDRPQGLRSGCGWRGCPAAQREWERLLRLPS